MYRRYFWMLICSILFTSASIAQTEVSGNVQGEWNLDDSPYIVVGDITIQSNNELIIEPGVQIRFNGPYRLIVNGLLTSVGTEQDFIIYTRHRENIIWRGIRIIQADHNTEISYSIVEYCETIGQFDDYDARGGGIFIDRTDATISHNIIRYNTSAGRTAGVYAENCSPIISYNTIVDNVANTNGALEVERSNALIIGNVVMCNRSQHGGGIICYWGAPTVENNVIIGNVSTVMRWGCGLYFAYDCRAIVRNNLIIGNDGGGLYLGAGPIINEFTHNTIANNPGGPGILIYSNSSLTMNNSIVWGHDDPIRFAEGGVIIAYYSDIQNAENEGVQIRDGVINENPLFIDPNNNNYRLQLNSPCRNTGDPNSPPDPDGSRADMGYIYPYPYIISSDINELNFGICGINIEYQTSFHITLNSQGEEINPLNLTLRIPNNIDWLRVEPQQIRIQPNDTIPISVTLRLPNNIELGQYNTGINIFIDDNDTPYMLIPVRFFAVRGFGSIEGYVINTETMNGLPNALVHFNGLPFETLTDPTGYFTINPIPAWQYNITITHPQFQPYESEEFEIEPNQNVFKEINLLFARCLVEPEAIIDTIDQHQTDEIIVTITNTGTGPLDFRLTTQFRQRGNEPWSLVQMILTTDIVSDEYIYGVAFVDGRFFISGSNNEQGLGKIYVLDRYGNYLYDFHQFVQLSRGIYDLTWDGELLWGVDGGRILGFNDNGELRSTIPSPINPGRAIAWDEQRQLFWICNIQTDILGVDRRGQIVQRIPRNRSLSIYGLAVFPIDTTGYNLYILSLNPNQTLRVYKVNPLTGEYLWVSNLEMVGEMSPNGFFITPNYDYSSWCAMAMFNDNNTGYDILDVFYLQQQDSWMFLNETEGTVPPQFGQDISVFLNSGDIPYDTDLCGQITIEHNGRGENIVIPVVMRVRRPSGIYKDGDNPIPNQLKITSIYPNPLNSSANITFEISQADRIDLSCTDLNGRLVKTILTGNFQPGVYSINLNISDLSAGIYWVRLKSNNSLKISKLVVIK